MYFGSLAGRTTWQPAREVACVHGLEHSMHVVIKRFKVFRVTRGRLCLPRQNAGSDRRMDSVERRFSR
jgi:hypothetical protein